jgi:hypothetical protein
MVIKQAQDMNNYVVAWKFCVMEKKVRCWTKRYFVDPHRGTSKKFQIM